MFPVVKIKSKTVYFSLPNSQNITLYADNELVKPYRKFNEALKEDQISNWNILRSFSKKVPGVEDLLHLQTGRQ